ncbi:hypothetical protein KP509_11G063700 [Ceratopteris richardii]|uniref:TBCC domain-containing protein 1 n=1 Tax=Ceratopteris richardii TaxID=49495 RepID=A0A8T2TYV3_CERRI|nr:hypothetical protein KP509_11G063700 [Ceratopteris richardii]KAH7425640.1 hypothetical protein KP509_11G063700 [Ceratopteris richardii]
MNVGSSGCFDQKQQQLRILRVRREPFEYGLLPMPRLIFPDPLTALRGLYSKLRSEGNSILVRSTDGNVHIDCAGIALALDLSEDEAQLVLETLLSVLPDIQHGSSATSSPSPSDGSVSFEDFLLFLYIQNYKKPPIRPHKDAASVADVWPSSSAFDGIMATLSPLQIRTGRKSFPSQVDEESHQLSYIQKHLPQLLCLLANMSAEDETDSQVLTLEQFDHLGFLLHVGEKGCASVPLSQLAPFFANSDPDMPAAPVLLQQVLEWLLEHLSVVADRSQERCRENGPEGDVDVTMLDASANTTFAPVSPRGTPTGGPSKIRNRQDGLTYIDGITKVSVLKTENEICGGSVKISNCHDSVVYILAPMKYASIYGCSDSIIVLGAAEKVVKIEYCERVQLIVCSRRVRITNCRECLFNLAVNERPLILGENHNLQVAPYNTFYPRLEAHLAQASIDVSVNKWDKFLTLGVLDPHDSLPHAAGVADAPAEGASLLSPDRYTNFVIPKWNDSESALEHITKGNPFVIPKAYIVAQQQRSKAVDSLRNTLKNVPMDESRRQDLTQAIHVHFREWLYASGNIRQLYEFQDYDKD